MVAPRILFLCDHNAIRSPMAAGLLPGAASAGLTPADSIDLFACAAMAEHGIDLTSHTPSALDPSRLARDILVIALSRAAFLHAQALRPAHGFELEYWELPAIPAYDGNREQILDGFRAIRQTLKAHIANRFPR